MGALGKAIFFKYLSFVVQLVAWFVKDNYKASFFSQVAFLVHSSISLTTSLHSSDLGKYLDFT